MTHPTIIHALTLWQPWGQAVLNSSKRVENRGWPLKGPFPRWLALHFGSKRDKAGLEMARSLSPAWADLDWRKPGIYAAMRISGVRCVDDADAEAKPDPWFFGPYGFEIDAVAPLKTPILMPGRQGLWRVPDTVVAMGEGGVAYSVNAREALEAAAARREREMADCAYLIKRWGGVLDILAAEEAAEKAALHEGGER